MRYTDSSQFYFLSGKILAILLALVLARPAQADEIPVWSDSANGLALGGYDPVSYFTRRKPTLGKDNFQYDHKDTYWKFENFGNREEFKKHPYQYSPQFAGYDPYALAKGRTIRGSPTLFVIYKNRLFLFQNIIYRRLWHDNKDKYLLEAIDAWPKLSKNLLRKIEVD